ncbi:MAG: signal peptidase I [Mycobacteriaceae bacterium]
MSKHQPLGNGTSVFGWIRQIAGWLILFVMLLILTAAVIVPRVTGSTPYTVLTSSMEPTYPPGTLIIVRETDPDDLSISDPITYQLESGKPEVVTHRIIAVEQNARGEKTFITQGDNNSGPDTRPVRPVQIRGKVWYSVPYIGHLNTWITGKQHTLLLAGAIALLIIYASYMFASGIRENRRDKKKTDQPQINLDRPPSERAESLQ